MPKVVSKRCLSQAHIIPPVRTLLISSLFLFVMFVPMFCTAGGANATSSAVALPVCNARIYGNCFDTLTHGNSISYGENLTSDGERFQLGFFVRQENTYLGIWYNVGSTKPTQVIVWVANRDNPIPSPRHQNCSLVITNDGSAQVLDSNNQTYWCTNATIKPSSVNRTELKLFDDGNLQLMENRGTRSILLWQSFDQPTDTFLPGMAINRVNLTSWVSPENPAQGNYTFQKQNTQNNFTIFTITNNKRTIPDWDSSYSSLHPKVSSLLSNNPPGNELLRLVMNNSGSIQLWELQKGQKWSLLWSAPADQCDLRYTCGNYGVCDAGNSFKCKCLPGFQPSDPERWEMKDFSGGSLKKTPALCGDKFLSLPMVKVPPDPYNRSKGEEECKDECMSECACKAYSYDSGQSNCLTWTSDLNHIQEEYYNANARTLYIRVASSDLELRSRTCPICGANMIPYPLSTRGDCGDPTYFNFQCNATNGQVYFKAPGGNSYKISVISVVNPDQRRFLVQLPANINFGHCDPTYIKSKVLNLNTSAPFDVINCSVAHLMNRPDVVEVEMSWKPPPPPACKSLADCKDWTLTTCALDAGGKSLCLCSKDFGWNSTFLNCTPVHHKQMSLWLKAGVATASGTVLLLLSIILSTLHLRRRRARKRAGNIVLLKNDDTEEIDLPLVDYESILAATNNFSDANKLGAGGFGPVFKGKLGDGNEIAVKRLSAASAQGIEEFRNEVVLIAKLQHRNLVRLLGYCVKTDEKILIYEYMPNKSLDSFLFDHTISPLLDWKKRFNIILGVARGLLYLHQDSRLRIIHRDLKPSNILLDEELNPKISDFGLARIVGGNDTATSTTRVIGTYGYMAPEYALDGYFSTKSDVYSFGIVVLEVVSGRRCTSLLPFDSNLTSLLGYAWTLWSKGEALDLVDKAYIDSYDSSEVKRCINVGLLCVQEDPSVRPSMSTVLLMLGGDNMNLPYPKQPVFVARRPPSKTTSSSSKFGNSSNVELTTMTQGR